MSVKYSSTRTIQSQTFPGVSFTLRKMSDSRRRELYQQIAPLKEKERGFQRRFAEIDDRRVPLFDAEGKPKMNVVTAEQERGYATKDDERLVAEIIEDLNEFRDSEISPAYIRWGLLSIDGLDIDDEPATIDNLLEYGPADLTQEIIAAIMGKADLDADEKKTS